MMTSSNASASLSLNESQPLSLSQLRTSAYCWAMGSTMFEGVSLQKSYNWIKQTTPNKDYFNLQMTTKYYNNYKIYKRYTDHIQDTQM